MRRFFASIGLLGLGVASACSGDPPLSSSSGNVVGDAGSDVGQILDDAGGGEELDGGAVSDGGPLDLGDGGVDPEDAGGGTCNAQNRGTSPKTTSTCSTTTSVLTGGTLVAGTYDLAAVTVYQTNCTGFRTTEHAGRLVITAVNATSGAGAAEHSEFYKITGATFGYATLRNFDLTPTSKTKSPAVESTTCPKAQTVAVSYASFVDRLTTKQKLVIVRPFGGATARFEWVKVR
ncbi:MAG: hypothetical protein HOO96_39295 [Polyangiaceae bacterium]|nr:hypothetical protein [Polyangiaceae bacterium]